eukprot:NODE_3322_length_801_cov_308.880697.p2 GENE.NODE_3322_length_801_cov_308.880697~~NODE_3322_length_801_cov_308.880697.p2  ORF type:complete len:171 (-),score=54.23 NODE_3322_length_801_cov_308.880697:271-783(-)
MGRPSAPPATETAQARTSRRARAAMPTCIQACMKLSHVSCPFVLSVLMITVGFATGGGSCERNLSGLLVWFGTLGLMLGVLSCLGVAVLASLRVAIAAAMLVFAVVGVAWSMGGAADPAVCGSFLVYFSATVWFGGFAVVGGYAAFVTATHLLKLQRVDEQIQRGGILVV